MKIKDSERLSFTRFTEDDAPALADLLADPSLTRHITTSGSTPERCLASARRRIAWHNSTWDDYGYGVWALRARSESLAPAQRLLGWCGFVPPDGDDPDPEILYALDAEFRGRGVASEAARHAIDWLFETTDYAGVTAVISTVLNPGSVNLVSKLGLAYRGKMNFSLFLPNPALVDEVVEYEIWRMERDSLIELEQLAQQVGYRAGQLSAQSSFPADRILRLLLEALLRRFPGGLTPERQQQCRRDLETVFRKGQDEAFMDCYHVTREGWTALSKT